tara:strand:+ start:346 stop:1557 length:1212 start_codon:yes stop_codon:yes gene_type:complete
MKHQKPIQISLDKITEDYEQGLLDQLRGFGVEGELFETWVPDPDPTNSILNLAEAAVTAGSLGGLTVTVSRETMRDISCDRLIDELGKSATVYVEDSDDTSVIYLTDLKDQLTSLGDSVSARRLAVSNLDAPETKTKTSLDFNSAGREELPFQKNHQETRNSLYDLPVRDVFDAEGTVEENNLYHRLSAEEDGRILEVQVDPKSHTVEKAVFRGSWERDVAALLDLLCGLVEGRPIQDMSDHAVGRLEYEVRGTKSRPVPGIVLPSGVDQRFSLIQSFVRKILAQYRQLTGYQEIENVFYDRAGTWWSSLTDGEKAEKVNQIVQMEAENLGFDSSEVEFAGLEYGVRVLIRFSGGMANPVTDKQSIMMRFEQLLIERLDPRLELFLEPVQDQSTLRRLSAGQE